jgi:NAD(P)-dependent dehydrogenase (short-subunit alcohol dehydrogenase family)
MQLEGKVALVTGGGTGIGAATARRFAVEGAHVVVTGRRPEPLERLAGEIGGAAAVGDAASTEDMRGAVADAVARFGGLDIVVAAAGGSGTPAAGETSDERWAVALDSNLTSCFVTCREALPALLSRGGGSIVIVASAAALAGPPALAGYTAAKTGLIGLTRSLAVDYGPRGIRVNALCPAWVRTPMADEEMDRLADSRALTRAEAYELATRLYPLRRAADPEEIAACCLFLASAESSFVTGTVLVADGGGSAVDVGTLPFADFG